MSTRVYAALELDHRREHVNRINMLKRQTYGEASLALLRNVSCWLTLLGLSG